MRDPAISFPFRQIAQRQPQQDRSASRRAAYERADVLSLPPERVKPQRARRASNRGRLRRGLRNARLIIKRSHRPHRMDREWKPVARMALTVSGLLIAGCTLLLGQIVRRAEHRFVVAGPVLESHAARQLRVQHRWDHRGRPQSPAASRTRDGAVRRPRKSEPGGFHDDQCASRNGLEAGRGHLRAPFGWHGNDGDHSE
jgi:hypothetical protein